MPALPPVDGVLKVVLQGHQSTEKWALIFHIANAGGAWTQGDADVAASTFSTRFSTRFGASLSSVGGIDRCDVTDLTSDTGVVASDTTTHAFTGGAAATSPQVAFVVHWAIPRHYRGGHPRTYLPCVQEADVDVVGNVSAGTKGNVSAGAAGLVGDVQTLITSGGAGCTMVCVHYRRNNVQLAVPLLDPITTGICRNVVGTQRRRLPKIT